ncbi:hypothetical protein BC831DRAFT_456040 [Entophlyctis helioformis]|nr:hypothetical protein BC831DRAFT_456040 [Entophlyctis helioformis]
MDNNNDQGNAAPNDGNPQGGVVAMHADVAGLPRTLAPAPALAPEVMALLQQVRAEQAALQAGQAALHAGQAELRAQNAALLAQIGVLDRHIANMDIKQVNWQLAQRPQQRILPLVKERRGFTVHPGRTVPDAFVLQGRDGFEAGLLPGPATLGFEFPGSKSDMWDLGLQELYHLVQFYDIVDGQLRDNEAHCSQEDLIMRLNIFLGVTVAV